MFWLPFIQTKHNEKLDASLRILGTPMVGLQSRQIRPHRKTKCNSPNPWISYGGIAFIRVKAITLDKMHLTEP